jgi:hypothetical protein
MGGAAFLHVYTDMGGGDIDNWMFSDATLKKLHIFVSPSFESSGALDTEKHLHIMLDILKAVAVSNYNLKMFWKYHFQIL